MKVTTVRFGEDLWRLLEFEASESGVSVSQYIREAALARAAAAARARGTGPFELLAGAVREAIDPEQEPTASRRETERALAVLARVTANASQGSSARRQTPGADATRPVPRPVAAR